ncbi:MAG: hypothetical protein KDA65_11365 [Planctomycetaceae bacterium]|nr:hypothetical protein [Planctomycetaceae bacterium]
MYDDSNETVGVSVELEIEVSGPILVADSESGPWGVDAVFNRDLSGRLSIPGTLLRGLYREALDKINRDIFGNLREDVCESTRLFDKKVLSELDAIVRGTIENNSRQADSWRFPVVFSDFVSTSKVPAPGENVVTHNSLNEWGSALKGSLRVIDCPVGYNETVCFRGTVTCVCETNSNAVSFRDNLVAMFTERTNSRRTKVIGGVVPALGQFKSIGYGKIMGAKIIDTFSNPILPNSDNSSRVVKVPQPLEDAFSQVRETSLRPLAFNVKWSVLDPFCIPEKIVKGNVYESTDYIGGDILKGAIAGLLRRACGLGSREAFAKDSPVPLCRIFDSLQISTAFPEGHSQIPSSLVVLGQSVRDLALMDLEQNWRNLAAAGVPAFYPDWKPKDFELIVRHYSRANVPRKLRVRTAISSDQRSAENEKLFANRIVIPDGHVWNSRIHINPDKNNSFSSDELAEAMTHLHDILDSKMMVVGKTGARVKGLIHEYIFHEKMEQIVENTYRQGREFYRQRFPDTDDGFLAIVVLKTPALLLDWRNLAESSGFEGSQDQMFQVYDEAFRELSDDRFRLVNQFARHELIGGYKAWSMPRIDVEGKPYNPILLTAPGSTFVLRSTHNEFRSISKVLERWMFQGLRPEQSMLRKCIEVAYGTDINNRYVPTNGYGEVQINDQRHLELRFR